MLPEHHKVALGEVYGDALMVPDELQQAVEFFFDCRAVLEDFCRDLIWTCGFLVLQLVHGCLELIPGEFRVGFSFIWDWFQGWPLLLSVCCCEFVLKEFLPSSTL